jgi:hypothetical protein
MEGAEDAIANGGAPSPTRPHGGGGGSGGGGDNAEWGCPACTYLNKAQAAKCELCDSPKP